jgi:serine phosphatase RsbU (regulator of sigma subunit)
VQASSSGWELSDALEAVEAASPVDAVDAVTGKLAAALGSARVSFLIADFAGRSLTRLGTSRDDRPELRRMNDDSAESVSLACGNFGDVLASQRPQSVAVDGGWRLLAPVTQRGEAIGLLEVLLDSEPDADVATAVERAAHILAFVVIANRRHTDLFEWGQRSARFELSAKIQRRLLPGAFTCEGGEFTLSAWLEPAATIGGDTFDYSVERDVLHLSVTDAMGHGVASALAATLCVSSLRNARRRGASLVDQAAAADAAMRLHAPQSFVTGTLGRLDLHTGVLEMVNAGHVLPLLQRGADITPVTLPVDLPFGLTADRSYHRTEVQLQAGDRLVFVTDGMLERRAAGVPLRDVLQQTRGLHPREATRRLNDVVIEVVGPQLEDDATTLVLDWHGPERRQRDSRSGADRR